MNIKELSISHLSSTGHGVAILDNETIYVLGAFPLDIVSVSIYKKSEGISYAELKAIIQASPYRTYSPEHAPFYHANAPWEHMDISHEQETKKELVNNIFTELNSDISLAPTRITHYRNKATYSFMQHQGKLAFALFSRGTNGNKKVPQRQNLLVHERINKTSKQFLTFFNQKSVSSSEIKYLILRYSYSTDTVSAHLLVPENNRKKLPWKKEELETFIKHNKFIQGVLVSHSDPNIRSSITTKDFYQVGTIDISENVLGINYQYHPSSFFQIYPESFAEILKDISRYIKDIESITKYTLVDLFSGVGIIGIHLSKYVNKVISVEHSPLSKHYAEMNATENDISNFSFLECSVDQALEQIRKGHILVVDPPRSGLTHEVIKTITEALPQYIIYISCNPETQARDVDHIKKNYEYVFSKAYNLFPKTPHVEHVMMLKKKTES